MIGNQNIDVISWQVRLFNVCTNFIENIGNIETKPLLHSTYLFIISKKLKNVLTNWMTNTYEMDSYYRHIPMVSISKEIDFDTVECLRV